MVGRPLVRQERRDRGGLGETETVADARVREVFLDPPNERRGDRRSAVGDAGDPADVEPGEVRLCDGERVDRGHAGEQVDPLLDDRVQERAYVEGRQHHRGAAECELQEQLAVAPGDVEERHRHQVARGRAVRAVDAQHADRRLDVGQEVLVAGHRPLGEAGGAAGVEDRGEVTRGEVRCGARCTVGQRGTGPQDGSRTAVVEHVLDLPRGEARVHRHRDRAGELRAEESEHPVDPGRQQVGHPVPPLHAGVGEATGHPGRAVPQLPVRQTVTAHLDQRLGVGTTVDRAPEHRHQRRRQVGVVRDSERIALNSGHVERRDASRSGLDRHGTHPAAGEK